MQVILILDAEGPNPDYDPPNPVTEPGAFHAYNVPHSIMVPAGTILPSDPLGLDWIHCFPISGLYVDQKTRRPVRGPDGPVIAEPYDDEARAAVARHLVAWSAERKLTVDKGAALLAKMVAAAKVQQEKNDRENAVLLNPKT